MFPHNFPNIDPYSEHVVSNTPMQFIYCFANTSLVLRVIQRLSGYGHWQVETITVFYLGDFWVVRVRLQPGLSIEQEYDVLAFLDEHGWYYRPTKHMQWAIAALDRGCRATDVMNQYHTVIISHGEPQLQELYLFRERFIEGLGYCPQSLA